MPGHVKKGGKQEADPDPSPWLVVSNEMRKEDFLKPYDAKKSVWVPDGEGGFDEALIDSVDGDKVHVKVGWEPKTFKSEQVISSSTIMDMFVPSEKSTKIDIQVMQVNPPKMERFEDVSNMTYLNEAAVLWNLKSRYVAKLIYVRTHIHIIFLKCLTPDLFRALLRGYQPLQTVPNLHKQNLSDVHWEETK